MNMETLRRISYGMYIISSKKDEKLNGQIANTVFQITSEPPTIAVSINKQNLTHDCISGSGVFSVSILAKDTPMKFIGAFGFKSGRETDKFAGVKYLTGKTGAPVVLDNAVGFLEAEVLSRSDAGTHTIFIGKVIEAEIIGPAEPMTYAYYHEVKKGLSPKTAPTYIREGAMPEKNEAKASSYKCTVCGYIYDPAKGDPDGGIKPGTPFEQIPDTWVCPVCGADKSVFEKVKE